MIAQSTLRHRESPFKTTYTVPTPTVFVIDPDPARVGLSANLSKDIALMCNHMPAAGRSLPSYDGSQGGCLVLELRILDASGFQIRRRLADQNQYLPMVFVTSGIDVSTAVSSDA